MLHTRVDNVLFYVTILILCHPRYLFKTAKLQWNKTQEQLLESKKPFGVDISKLKKTPSEERKVVEIAMKFAFQIDSIIMNLYSGMFI